MKQLLLSLALGAMAFGTAHAEGAEASAMGGFVGMGISNDGNFMVHEAYGTIYVYDKKNNQAYSHASTNDTEYIIGNGNFLTDTVFVGASGYGVPAIWRAGSWRRLAVSAADPAGIGMANGISSDMARICGNASTGAGYSMDEARLMYYPCYWDRRGTSANYGNQTALPFPSKDFMGITPQGVTALCVSDNGKLIAGQVVSGIGFIHDLILYRQNEAGEWSYSTPLSRLINPNKLELGPYPEEGPAYPSPETFMTDEELAAYKEAFEKYTNDPETYPDPTYAEFMTPEEIAEYNAASDEYNKWAEGFNKYYDVLTEVLNDSPDFVFNLVQMSPSGEYIALSRQQVLRDANGEQFSLYTPYLYNTITDEVKVFGEDINVIVTDVNNDGDILGYDLAGDAELGYVYKHAQDKWMKLGDYLTERAPSLADWVAKNWMHNVEVVVDYTTNETDFVDLEITGKPFASRNWNHFIAYAYDFWNGEFANNYVSYIIDFTGDQSAISTPETAGALPVDIYDLNGRHVYSGSKDAFNSNHGIYIVREGNKTVKIRR